GRSFERSTCGCCTSKRGSAARRDAAPAADPRSGHFAAMCYGTRVSDKTVVSLGTATPGGGFPLYGGAVADVINAQDPTLDVQPKNTKGSTENVPLLEAETLDIALVQGEVALDAPKTLRVLFAMYPSAGMFVVRADSPYRTIDDLRGTPVAFGAQGSGL